MTSHFSQNPIQQKHNRLRNSIKAFYAYPAPAVKHINRGMVSTGNFIIIDGKAKRIIDACEVNTELFLRINQYAMG
jgi:hypothetical protein